MSKGNAILITGACGNIGKNLVLTLVENLASEFLICCDMSINVWELEKISKKIIIVECELNHPQKFKQELKSLKDKGIYISKAILAHGKLAYGKLGDIDYSDFNKLCDYNLNSCFHVLKELIPYLIEYGGGEIVVVASQFGKVAAYDLVAYCTSKAALIQLVKCIALDYADKKIIINSVSPGIMSSPMSCEMQKSGSRLNVNWKLLTSRLPIEEILVEDVVAAILFLLKQKSVTGEDIIIDGGYSIR